MDVISSYHRAFSNPSGIPNGAGVPTEPADVSAGLGAQGSSGSGTPSDSADIAAGSGSQGSGTNSLVLDIPGSIDMGTTAAAVNITVPIVGGTGVYTGTFSSTGLPPGLTWASDGNNNGLLSGQPTTATGSPFAAALTARDNTGNFGTVTVICNVS